MSPDATVTVDSRAAFARLLYDRAVAPSDTGRDRIRLAVGAVVYAREKWPEIVAEYGGDP